MSSSSETLEIPGYQVLQYLGSGARSTIWQIRDCRTDEVFALKRVVKRQVSDVRYLEQAENEYETSQHFSHPSIRRIHKIRRVKRWLSLREIHLLMEYCEGRTIQESRPTRIVDIVRIFLQVAEALTHINSTGYVHADMKPNNILVGDSGKVKIIDLGQSCPSGTVKQRIQGTPDFIAPEQVHRRPLDARTDVYNFGAALYWTLTGQPIPTVLPRSAGVPQLTDLAVTPLEEHNAEVPVSLSKLVHDCIELRPRMRPTGMEKVSSRLSLIHYLLTRGDAEGERLLETEAPEKDKMGARFLEDTAHGMVVPLELPADAIPDDDDPEGSEVSARELHAEIERLEEQEDDPERPGEEDETREPEKD